SPSLCASSPTASAASVSSSVSILHSHSAFIFLHFFFKLSLAPRDLHSFPTRRSSDLARAQSLVELQEIPRVEFRREHFPGAGVRSEEHTSELQSRRDLVCRLLLEKKTDET